MKKKSLYTLKFAIARAGYKSGTIYGAVLAESQEIAVHEGRKVVEESAENTGAKVDIKLLTVSKVKNDFFIVAHLEKTE